MKTTFLLAVALVVGALACKGGASERPLFDPLHADRLAHEALISATQLPGSGWRVVTDDEFIETGGLGPGGPACDGVSALVTETGKGVIGHAQRGLERPTPQFTRVGVTFGVEIMVYDVDAHPDRLIAAFRDLARDGSLVKCLSVTRSAGRLLSASDATPSTKAPANGAAIAFDREFTALQGPPLTRRDEIYVWQQSNVVVALTVSTPREAFSPDLSKGAVRTVQDGILKASKDR